MKLSSNRAPSRMRRRTWWLALVAWLPALTGCGGSSSDASTGPTGSDGPLNPSLHLVLHGLSGRENLLTVKYAIGSAITPRSVVAPSQLHTCTGDGASITCDIPTTVGSVVTLYAVEFTDGSATQLRGAAPPAVPAESVEFIDFAGDCQTQAPGLEKGDCAVNVTTARSYAVTADFAVMKEVVFRAVGAGVFTVSVAARDQLSIPAQTNGIVQAGPGTFNFLVGPDVSPMHVDWLPLGSTVTVVAAGLNQAKFLRWEGPCEGTGKTCTLRFVDSGTVPTATAYFEYWSCTVASPMARAPCVIPR